MDEIKIFIEAYLDELRTNIGQFPRPYWTLFPKYYYHPYLIRAKKCSNGVAIKFTRSSKKESIKVESTKKRTEEIFLPYLPHPPYYAVFAWTNARRFKIIDASVINYDFSKDPEKGKKFQRSGEDFHRMSVMHLEESNEVQMINCRISGVNDKGRLRFPIHFLWMMTGECQQFTEQQARDYARDDFGTHLNRMLFLRNPGRISDAAKKYIVNILLELKTGFQELISRTDVDEQEIQDFLEDHRFLIDLNAKQVWPKQSLGEDNQADFILGYSDGIRVVEIKRPFYSIFNTRREFSSITREAISELSRYQRWIESNESMIRKRYSSGILKKGWGIIGRTIEMNNRELVKLTAWNSESDRIELKSFDDLLRNFDLRIDELK